MEQGQDQLLTKKERRELKRQEKEKALIGERQKAKMGKAAKWVIIILIVAGALGGLYYFLKGEEPEGKDYSEAIPILERSHVSRSSPVTDYNSNPPTSGKHWSDEEAPTARGTHNEEIADESMVHNLEHGEVWISYKPEIPDGVKEELRKLARDTYKVVLTVRSKNDTDIALAAWGRLDKFNLDGKSLDIKRIEDFISRYRNNGPELIP